jgi:hypothetical protein
MHPSIVERGKNNFRQNARLVGEKSVTSKKEYFDFIFKGAAN